MVYMTQAKETLYFLSFTKKNEWQNEETNGIDTELQDQGDREWWGLWPTTAFLEGGG